MKSIPFLSVSKLHEEQFVILAKILKKVKRFPLNLIITIDRI